MKRQWHAGRALPESRFYRQRHSHHVGAGEGGVLNERHDDRRRDLQLRAGAGCRRGCACRPAFGIELRSIRIQSAGGAWDFAGLDAARASAGFTLFAPMMGDGAVYLIDLRVILSTRGVCPILPAFMAISPRRHSFLQRQDPQRYLPWAKPFKGGAALEADWNGRILWEVREPNHHHDGRRLRNGNVLLLCGAELPDSIAGRIQGGRPGTEVDGKIWADYLVELTRDGREGLGVARLGASRSGRIPHHFRRRTSARNGHTGTPSPNCQMETCWSAFRNISTVVKIARDFGRCCLEARTAAAFAASMLR